MTALLWHRARGGRLPGGAVTAWAVVLSAAGVAAACTTSLSPGWTAAHVAVIVAVCLAARPLTAHLHAIGRIAVPVSLTAHLLLLAWCAQAVWTSAGAWQVRAVAAVWLIAGVPHALLILLEAYLNQERLLRSTWRRPRRAPRTQRRAGQRVSVHVPCHAEPPDVVIATLDALAAQAYDDYEVLVIDNNTTDPNLWQPVRAHCRTLGPRFRFHHVEGLEGAKAGALNYALDRTCARATVVAVLDADYQARPDFLSRLTALFDDPSTGFVQVRHDYRGWRGNPYLTACYWEYRLAYGTYLVARAERGAGIIAGTMCLLRATALREVGGWAQWCSSEDSEMALRLHAAGYGSYYFDEAFGHGLVPDTFGGYRKQRARWVFGPAQEVRRHWRLLLPRRWARPSGISGWHKLLHAHHGAREMIRSAHTAITMACVAVFAGVLIAHGTLSLQPELPVVALLLAASGLAVRSCLFRYVLGCSARETALALWAQAALHHITWAAVLPSWWRAHRPWLRTSKFPGLPAGWGAFMPVWPEVCLGVLWSLGACAVALLAVSGLAALCATGMLLLFLLLAWSAPALARRADRELAVAAEPGRAVPATGGDPGRPVVS